MNYHENDGTPEDQEIADRKSDLEVLIALAADHGYILTLSGALKAWTKYSEGMAASWMLIDHADEYLWDNAAYHIRMHGEKEVVDYGYN